MNLLRRAGVGLCEDRSHQVAQLGQESPSEGLSGAWPPALPKWAQTLVAGKLFCCQRQPIADLSYCSHILYAVCISGLLLALFSQ